jgi:uncharacterized protein (TIGR02246 family)
MLSRKSWATFAIISAIVAFITIESLRSTPKQAVAAGQGAEPKSTPATSAAETEIRKINSDYATAMMAGNLEAVMAYWAADADYVDEAGKTTKGSAKIAELFRKALPDLKGSKIVVRVNSLKFLRPEVCLEDGTVEKNFQTGSKDTNRFAIVWTRTGDKWLISSVRDLPSEVTDLPSLAAIQLKDLEWLVGEWIDDEPKADVALKVSWSTNKAFLVMDYVVKREGAEPLEVTMRIGWDGHNNRIRSWIFDSQGGFAEGYLQKDGNRWLVGISGILPDGGTGGSTNIYEFKDANSFVWKALERDVDGQPLADAEVKFVRKSTKK